jgi:very-short-patch-repair endonuclease
MVRNVASGQRITEAKYLESKLLRQRLTPVKNLLWAKLRKNGLGGYHFRRQQIIAGFIVDFYCYAAGLIVEVDGAVHQLKKEADLHRDTIMMAKGFRVVRFTNREVLKNIESVLEKIADMCAQFSVLKT